MTALAERRTAAAYEVVLPTSASRPEWLAARRSGIGGSDAAAVLGVGGDPLRVYAEKTVEDCPPIPETPAMMLGRLLEDPVARLWAAENGMHVRKAPALLRSTRWPWMLASVDRFVHPHARGGAGPVAIYEGKARNSFASREWDDAVPPTVVAQCWQYLAVTGLPRAYVGCLVGGGELRSYTVDADDDLLAEVAETERLWWERHVLGGTVPDLTSGGNAALLAAIYRGGGPVLDVTGDVGALGLIEQARQAKGVTKAAEVEADLLTDRVRLLLGDHESAEANGRVLATWKSGERRAVDLTLLAISRKLDGVRSRSYAPYRGVKSIERVESVPTQCISVDSPTRTYCAGWDMVPTHNTLLRRLAKMMPLSVEDLRAGVAVDGSVQTTLTPPTLDAMLTSQPVEIEAAGAPDNVDSATGVVIDPADDPAAADPKPADA